VDGEAEQPRDHERVDQDDATAQQLLRELVDAPAVEEPVDPGGSSGRAEQPDGDRADEAAI
jgi:hypothetical protein